MSSVFCLVDVQLVLKHTRFIMPFRLGNKGVYIVLGYYSNSVPHILEIYAYVPTVQHV